MQGGVKIWVGSALSALVLPSEGARTRLVHIVSQNLGFYIYPRFSSTGAPLTPFANSVEPATVRPNNIYWISNINTNLGGTEQEYLSDSNVTAIVMACLLIGAIISSRVYVYIQPPLLAYAPMAQRPFRGKQQRVFMTTSQWRHPTDRICDGKWQKMTSGVLWRGSPVRAAPVSSGFCLLSSMTALLTAISV